MTAGMSVDVARWSLVDVRQDLSAIAGYDIVKLSPAQLKASATDADRLGNRAWRVAAGLGSDDTPNAWVSRVALSLWNVGDLLRALATVQLQELASRFAEIERLRETVSHAYGGSLKDDLLGVDVEARRANPSSRRAIRIANQARLRLLEQEVRRDYWADVSKAAAKIDRWLERLVNELDEKARVWTELRPAPAEVTSRRRRSAWTTGWRPSKWALGALGWSSCIIPVEHRQRWCEEYRSDLYFLPESERTRRAQLRYVLQVAARSWQVRNAVARKTPARAR